MERLRRGRGCAGRQVAPATRAVLGNTARELVPEDDRLARAAEMVVAHLRGHVGPIVEAMAGVEVRPAEAAAQHLETHLPHPGRLAPACRRRRELRAYRRRTSSKFDHPTCHEGRGEPST